MNIAQIKADITKKISASVPGYVCEHLTFNKQLDQVTGEENPDWVSHWDNDNRIRVAMPREVFNKVMVDRSFDGLALKAPEIVTPEGKEPYFRLVIITPESILGVL